MSEGRFQGRVEKVCDTCRWAVPLDQFSAPPYWIALTCRCSILPGRPYRSRFEGCPKWAPHPDGSIPNRFRWAMVEK